MTKKLVSLLFILALVATTLFAINTGSPSFNNYEYASYSNSQTNTHSSSMASNQKISSSNALSDANSPRTFKYSAFNTNFTTNQNTYKPGQWVNVTADTTLNGFNGTVGMSLTTPSGEKVVNPTKSATDIFFNDPQFKNVSLADWHPYNLTAKVNSNYLTLNSSLSSAPANLSYITHKDIKGTFTISFNYKRNTNNNINMTLNYFNGTHINTINLNSTAGNSTNPTTFTTTIVLDTTNSTVIPLNLSISKILSGYATFLIYPISIKYATPDVVLYKDDNAHQGVVQNIWLHGSTVPLRDPVTINYYINSSTSSSHPFVSFNFTLPTTQLYLGEWQLNISVNTVDNIGSFKNSIHYFVVPIDVQYNIYFNLTKLYVYRGYNETSSSQIYKDETNSTSVFSPNDTLVYVGQLFTNVTGTPDKLDSVYFNGLTENIFSNTTIGGSTPYNWTDNTVSNYYRNQVLKQNTTINSTIMRNLLPPTLMSNFTWILKSQIPPRGIYGTVDQYLNVTFPSSIKTTLNDIAHDEISNSTELKVHLNPLQVRFDLNVTNYNIPYNRTWFLTEFMEGNFSVKTWHYNLNSLMAVNNATNQSFDWGVNIPTYDLLFSVYLKNTNTSKIEQNLTVTTLNDGKTFYFAGTISPNLNTLNLYHLGITWMNPRYATNSTDKNVEFKDSTTATYSIKGTLTVQVPLSTIVFRQGDNLYVNFNVTIDQLNNKPATGLSLNAVIGNNSNLFPQIIEKNGQFTILMTLPENMSTGFYAINIYKTSTDSLLGTVNIQIITHGVDFKDIATVIPIIYSIFGSVLAVIVILGFLVQIMRLKK